MYIGIMKFITTLITCAPAVLALWPIPESYTHGDSVVFIDQNTPVTYNGKQSVRRIGKTRESHLANFVYLRPLHLYPRAPSLLLVTAPAMAR